jgi:hypothetical protein
VPPPAAAPPAVAPPAPPASPHSPLTGMAAMLADATSRGWLEELGGLGGLEPESTGAGVEQMLAAQLPPPEPTPVADISPEGLDPSPVSPAQTPQVSVRLATVVSGAASQKLVIPPAAGYPAGRVVTNASPGRPPREGEAGHSSPPCRNRWEKLRIGTLGFGTGRQKRLLERWMNPKLARRACPCEHGLPSCRGNWAGVAKRPRERSPTRNPYGSVWRGLSLELPPQAVQEEVLQHTAHRIPGLVPI